MKIIETKTSDGITFNGLFSEPTSKSKKIIIHIHGMAGSVLLEKYYPIMHEQYPQSGFAFLVGENRGTGTMTEFVSDDTSGFILAGNALEKFEDCIYDIQGWIDYALSLGYEEIWLQSHSLGTSKVAYYMDKVKLTNIAGLIFLSPADMIGLVHDALGQKDHDILLPEANKLVSEEKGNQLLTNKLWGAEYLSAGTYLNMFDKNANTAIFNYGDENLGWRVVNDIYVPVIAITGTKDDGIAPVMDPKLAMTKLEQELKNSPRVETVVYEGAEHSFDGFGQKIVEDVLNFISDK